VSFETFKLFAFLEPFNMDAKFDWVCKLRERALNKLKQFLQIASESAKRIVKEKKIGTNKFKKHLTER
jgi:hypothetical protein